MGNRIIEFKDVGKRFNSLDVLADISFYLEQGEIVCLLGPSGCGKTTIFRLIAGLTTPDRGKVYLVPDTRIGYVFQEPRLLPWKTVEANLAFVQQNFLAEEEAKRIREGLLKLTGLANSKTNYPAELSGGMRQRLELIRALAIKPDLLLLDEPFKSVDSHLKIKLREMILKFWGRGGLSLLLITHDPEQAVLMADRIYIFSDKPGRIVETMELKQIQRQRVLNDKEIYDARERIIQLFMNMIQK